MREHERAVLLVEVLIEAKPGRRASEQAGKRRLAHRERITPHVLTIELDQVEGVEEHARLFRMLVPRSLGGAELSPVEYVQAIEEIAKADALVAAGDLRVN